MSYFSELDEIITTTLEYQSASNYCDQSDSHQHSVASSVRSYNVNKIVVLREYFNPVKKYIDVDSSLQLKPDPQCFKSLPYVLGADQLLPVETEGE